MTAYDEIIKTKEAGFNQWNAKGVVPMKMRQLREQDLMEYAVLYRSAYPGAGFNNDTAYDALRKRLDLGDQKTLVAVDESERILGGLTLIDYTIYQNYNELKMCGIGSVCVGLDAKKQGVARFMMETALQEMAQNDVPVSILYPFRHDFYQQMGWGQVGEVKEFKFAPASLPTYAERKHVRRYREGDLDGMKRCYDAFARPMNCMGQRADYNWVRRASICPDWFVYEEDGEIQGYVHITFKKHDTSFLVNDIIIQELIYTSQKAYFGLLGFLASQFDQIESIYYYTRRNDPFHHLLKEPRRENDIFNRLYHYAQRIGVSWMFRVINVAKALESRCNYRGANLDVTFDIEDSFVPGNSDKYTLILRDGKPQVIRGQESKYRVNVNISTFSQIFVNYLTLQDAVQIGRARVNDPSIIPLLDKAFALPEAFLLEFF